ncbi:glycosyl hydrolase family 18 protein [Hymenobacter sp. J193]|uniref:glycosyl hydrolase family 18 protein n=1 Tax=Hymenobacter sp. J193 TaxID=2898429 RepID=UPI0021518F7F|nr:glycosyl hydrolase family 18 protein [Hymenobacter sp. J193]MCR5886630.1 glycosyl hydrolase family 18 protein [Hymenobacter sp. J193]
MKTTILRKVLALLVLLLGAAPAFAQFKVIGYMPSWTGDVNTVQYDKLTHINYAFLLPNADGSLRPIENPSKLQSLVATAHARGVKVLISVGGWMNDGNPTEFVSIGNNATYTRNFTTNLVNFANQYNLDGIDIDWEHPTSASANGYAAVMQDLATQLHSRGKLLTTAVAGGTWAGPYILSSVLNNVDFLNIMAYDDAAPAHSTYALASQSISYWRGRGLAANKTVLGVPFYGQAGGETYASLLSRGADPNADLFQGIGYNGIPTMKSKTNLAFDQGGGIMIWQLGGDATGTYSLLTAINQVVVQRNGTTPPPATGVATVYKDCNYTGTAKSLPAGNYNLAALQSRGILDNDISSLKANAGYEVVLYENDNFTGASLTVGSAGNGCLVGNVLGTGNWNDKTTSLRVRTTTTSPGFSVTLQAEAANVNNGMSAETTTDAGGGQNMGWVDAGDYLVWNGINFPTTGTYTIEYRVASGGSGGTISSDLNAGSIQFGNSTIPGTGGWQSWQTVSKTVTINAGTYNFGIYAQTGGWNLNWVRITRAGARTALAAKESEEAQATQLYPNPVKDRLHVVSKLNLAGSRYSLVDARGGQVSSGTLDKGSVNVADLKSGIYQLIITTKDEQQITRRFAK